MENKLIEFRKRIVKLIIRYLKETDNYNWLIEEQKHYNKVKSNKKDKTIVHNNKLKDYLDNIDKSPNGYHYYPDVTGELMIRDVLSFLIGTDSFSTNLHKRRCVEMGWVHYCKQNLFKTNIDELYDEFKKTKIYKDNYDLIQTHYKKYQKTTFHSIITPITELVPHYELVSALDDEFMEKLKSGVNYYVLDDTFENKLTTIYKSTKLYGVLDMWFSFYIDNIEFK